MTIEQDVAEVRRLTNEPDDVPPYTDVILALRLDEEGGDIRRLVSSIWSEKAARYAELVDVQEGSSRRNLSSLYQQALAMSQQFGGEDIGGTRRAARTRPIERM